MKKIVGALSLFTAGFASLYPVSAQADQTSATVAAARMNGTILGGQLPLGSATFQSMVNSINSGDYYGAAMTAIGSSYFANYLPRRLAKQMQNPSLTALGVPDNDATTFIVAHLVGSGVPQSVSKLWSDPVTCLVSVNGTASHAFGLTAAQLQAAQWNNITCNAGQVDGAGVAIPTMHVGGYTTLSNKAGDGSYAQNAFTAGTNLRGIEYLYEISTGLTLPEMIVQDGAVAQAAPAFIPEGDPNFFVGTGQPACVSCHGGGASNLLHGYAAVADKFNFDPTKGFQYIAAPTTSTMKSLGSAAGTRTKVAQCIANHTYPAGFTTCNPDSTGADPNQSWDLTSWQTGGLLSTMGWKGPITGQGLNSLGVALGQAALPFQFLVQRVIGEICPLGSFSASSVASIASNAQAQDSFSYIVATVASDPSCR